MASGPEVLGGGDEWPLVGRDEQLAAVASRVERRLAGRPGPSGVVLVGEAGTGKTRLAAEVVGRAAGDVTTARVIATRAGSAIPLGALAPLLPADLEAAELRADALRWAADAVLPASGGPLLLTVDDAQHLDDASATVVLQLALGGRAVVVATVRSGERVPDAVTALWKDGLAERVDLSNLSRAAVADLLAAVLGGPVEGATARDVWTATTGNPLFVRELVIGAVGSGALVEEDGVWRLVEPLPTTPRLVELIDHRLEGLDADERDVLDHLAVGEPLGPDLLGPADPAVLASLEGRGLVTVARDGQRLAVRFAHPLYGDVVRARLPVLRARALSSRLADAVEAVGARRREDALRVALWRLDGGGEVDARLMIDAARRALFTYEHELAEHLASTAFAATGDPEAGLLLAEVSRSVGKSATTDEVLAQLEGSEAVAADPGLHAMVAVSRSTNLFWGLGRYEEAIDVLVRVEAALAPVMPVDDFAAVRANLEVLAGHPAEALAVVEPLLPEADGRLLVNAAIAGACALVVTGRGEEALGVAERAYAVHLALGDQQVLARPWIHQATIVTALCELGPLDEAERVAVAGYEDALERRETAAQAWFAMLQGRVALLRGRVVTAGRWFREGAVLFRDIDEAGPRRWSLAGRVIAAAQAGDLAEADEAYTALLAEPSPMRMMESEVFRARAWWHAQRGELDEARALLRLGLDDAEARRSAPVSATCAWDLVRFGAAAEGADRLDAIQGDGALLALRRRQARAVVDDDAVALDEVAGELAAIGAGLEAAEAWSAAAVAATRDGDRRRAAAAARRAADERVGLEGAFTSLLTAAPAASPLTDRQREIALLAAGGLPSKAIAERLHLSRRTVDNNLHQAFTKLGISSRADLPDALGLAPGD